MTLLIAGKPAPTSICFNLTICQAAAQTEIFRLGVECLDGRVVIQPDHRRALCEQFFHLGLIGQSPVHQYNLAGKGVLVAHRLLEAAIFDLGGENFTRRQGSIGLQRFGA